MTFWKIKPCDICDHGKDSQQQQCLLCENKRLRDQLEAIDGEYRLTNEKRAEYLARLVGAIHNAESILYALNAAEARGMERAADMAAHPFKHIGYDRTDLRVGVGALLLADVIREKAKKLAAPKISET